MPRMDWGRLLSEKRLGQGSQSGSSNSRSAFESDVDRIVFSGSFRRLAQKTQVHPLVANDHVHNRLTHSLEVSRVGATLGKNVAIKISKELPNGILPHDLAMITKAACLAHDIGNPPFGHAGEEAIFDWFDYEERIKGFKIDPQFKYDLQHYEGNAQGFRVISQIENNTFRGGLQLTCATLGAFLKYPG